MQEPPGWPVHLVNRQKFERDFYRLAGLLPHVPESLAEEYIRARIHWCDEFRNRTREQRDQAIYGANHIHQSAIQFGLQETLLLVRNVTCDPDIVRLRLDHRITDPSSVVRIGDIQSARISPVLSASGHSLIAQLYYGLDYTPDGGEFIPVVWNRSLQPRDRTTPFWRAVFREIELNRERSDRAYRSVLNGLPVPEDLAPEHESDQEAL